MRKILNFLRNYIINNLYLKINSDLYYKKKNKLYLGSLNFFRILLLNLLFPNRLFIALKYGQIFKNYNKSILFLKKKISFFSKEYPNFFDKKKISIIENSLQILHKDGAVLVESYFNEKIIEEIKSKYFKIISKGINLSKDNAVSTAKYDMHLCKFDNAIKSCFYDPGIILLLESYFLKDIYARNYPYFINTHVPADFVNGVSKSETADSYHVDHRVLATLYIFLDDVAPEGTCLEIVSGSHKIFNTNYPFSEKVLNNKEKKRFTGKKGSFHIHLGNTIHRACLKSNFDRLTLYFEYTIGPNVLLDVNKIALTLTDDLNINNLSVHERKFLKGIYPLTLNKGYEIKKDALVSNFLND